MSDSVAPEGGVRHLTGLLWGLSGGFMAYLQRMNAGIRMGAGAGETQTGRFFFPLDDDADFDQDAVAGTLRFGGDVRIVAHHGMLNTAVVAPWLVIANGSAVLTLADERGSSFPRVEIADVALPTPTVDGTTIMWTSAETRLRESGCDLFGGVYPPGELLAPVSARILWRGGPEGPSAAD